MPAKDFPDLNQKAIESSLQQYVLSKGHRISHLLTRYQAVAVNKEQAQLLECKKGPARDANQQSRHSGRGTGCLKLAISSISTIPVPTLSLSTTPIWLGVKRLKACGSRRWAGGFASIRAGDIPPGNVPPAPGQTPRQCPVFPVDTYSLFLQLGRQGTRLQCSL
ncbi:Uncharacterised protein [Cedecea neteri]|uniref:UbiC transcription regulator-associated domain-containing protein n=1 Tax=Cedecea neteri TaxID=158822 RepID=A0A2X3IGV3_9ENTR|nr:Uncharacterised protein [Cedecea neteri]